MEFLNDSDDALFGMARKVIYDDSFVMDLTLAEHVSPIWYVFKHPDWRCEEEVRIVLRESAGGPVFTISPLLLTRVIVGRCMPPNDVACIREWGSKRTPPLEVVATVYEKFTRTFGLA